MSKFFHGRRPMGLAAVNKEASEITLPTLSNRRQLLLFTLLTILLTIATVWGARVWFKDVSTLTFAVGDDRGVEARFANKLSAVLTNNASSLRLRIVKHANNDTAVDAFDRKQADLAILRTDAKVPSHARSVAILEHDLLLMFSPKNRKIETLTAFKGKKIAVVGADERNTNLFRRMLDTYGVDTAKMTITTVPPDVALDKLLAPNQYAGAIIVNHQSQLAKDKSYDRILNGPVGFKLNEISEAKAIARKIPGVSQETIEEGLLSASPDTPDDDIDTVGLQWLLVAQSTMSEQKGTELARTIFENKASLGLGDGFATSIEPADTDKNAFIAAQRGAAQYIDDDTRSFADRYSDLIYLGLASASVIGSLFAAFYAAVTRVAPERAGQLATTLLDIGEKIDDAKSLETLEEIQDELEAVLRQVIGGLRDGTISGDGLDTFRLGYDFVRDSVELRRQNLMRPNGRDDHVMVITKAAS